MPLKVERNDITKMTTEAIVNTAGATTEAGSGCDMAVYMAAGYDELHDYRVRNIGYVPEGEAFITPGFKLASKYIIHAVSPLFIDGESDEESKLRGCYRKSLQLAKENGIKSIAFPLIGTGSFGYPMVDGLVVAMDEVNRFLLNNDMDVTLVVFGNKATKLAKKVYPDIQTYIDQNYVDKKHMEEYADSGFVEDMRPMNAVSHAPMAGAPMPSAKSSGGILGKLSGMVPGRARNVEADSSIDAMPCLACEAEEDYETFETEAFKERLVHLADSFGAYTLYLIKSRNLKPVDVQNRGWISKHVFTKINKNPDLYQPSKTTAFQLCVGFEMNFDEAKDYIARAGMAFSPSKLDDVIWKYGIENGADIYDISDILEEYGFEPIVNF